MKIKTSELTGPALDWAVAKCEGVEVVAWWCDDREAYYVVLADSYTNKATTTFYAPDETYYPSTDWLQGGPLIERAGISVTLRYGSLPPNHVQDVWDAAIKPEFYTSGRPNSGVKQEVNLRWVTQAEQNKNQQKAKRKKEQTE